MTEKTSRGLSVRDLADVEENTPRAKELVAPAGWVPEFPGQRPPFQPGNQVAVGNRGPVTHGANSARRQDPIAHDFIDEVMLNADLDYLHEAHYQAALWAWAKAEAQAFLMNEYVDSIGIEEASKAERGQTSKLETARKLSTTAMNHRARLGLDPTSYARLSKDVAKKRGMDVALLLTLSREKKDREEQAK